MGCCNRTNEIRKTPWYLHKEIWYNKSSFMVVLARWINLISNNISYDIPLCFRIYLRQNRDTSPNECCLSKTFSNFVGSAGKACRVHIESVFALSLLENVEVFITMGQQTNNTHSYLDYGLAYIMLLRRCSISIWVWGIASLSLLGSFHNLLVDKRIVLTLSISYPINYEDRWGLMLCLENAPIKGSEAVRMNFLRNGVRENSSYSLAGRFLPPIQPINEWRNAPPTFIRQK